MKLLNLVIAGSIIIGANMKGMSQDEGGKNKKYSVPKVEDLVKVPPSPEAQAFTKFGNTPANIYSGTPNISVPIATISGREIQIPVSLNYDASGIKVEQTATSVGLGWSLTANGMVTRQVNGMPDDYIGATISYIPFYHPIVKSDYEFVRDFTASPAGGNNGGSIYPPGQLTRYFSFMYEVTKPAGLKYEIQPDTYSFNALGISGTLFIDYTNNTAYCIDSPDIKATPIFQSMGYSQVIVGWEIVDAAGTIYTFNEAEKTWVFDEDGAEGQRSYNSAWVLTNVVTKNNRDVVQFNYTSLPQWEQPQLAGRAVTRNDFPTNIASNLYPCGVDEELISVSPTYKIAQKELSSIVVNNKLRADFLPGAERLDLQGKNTLNQILIYGATGNLLNMYKLNHSYFGAPSIEEKELRLRLDNVEIYAGSTSTIPPQKYVFTYHSLELPSRESMAQDFWGFYNGMTGNTTLIPYNYDLDYGSTTFVGANRFPSFSHTLACSLTKIQYPTGGTSEFYYQPHTLPPTTYSSSFNEEYLVGGASLTGGTDPTDPLHYITPVMCDDKTTLKPKGVEQAFFVSSTVGNPHPYRFKLNIANSNPNDNPTNHMHLVAMYYAGLDGTQTRTVCDLLENGGATYFLYDGFSQGFSLDQPIALQEGYYRIVILNTMPSTSISVEVTHTRTVTSTSTQASGAGMRIYNIKDKDIDQSIKSDRYFYYGDLRNVPVASITPSLVSVSSTQTIGTLHADINFEEVKSFEQLSDPESSFSIQTCTSVHRYGSNRIQSNYFITYPIVSEVSFDRNGNNNGFVISSFYDNQDNYSGGFSKKNLLNGKVRQKWVFSRSGELLNQERNYIIQASAAPSTTGFYFSSNKSTMRDVTVKTLYNVPSEEFYVLDLPTFNRDFSGGEWLITHCVATGIEAVVFSDSWYHQGSDTHSTGPCNNTAIQIPFNPFNNNHPARQLFISYLTQGIPNVTANHDGGDGLVAIYRRVYNIIYCRHFGQDYKKQQYLYPRWWVKQDSSVSVSYSQSDSLVTYTRNLYENTSHYQVTRTRTKGSDGVIHTTQLSYAPEMAIANPSQPIWATMIAQNRIAEPIKIESTFGNNAPDFVQQTEYRSITAGYNTLVVPDKVKFSSGTNPLEDRIRYHQYDDYGNPTEISREGDTRVSFIWGYNGQMLIAEVKNASANEIFHTSFEDQGGNSTTDDCRTGRYSSTTGLSKQLTGLTPNKAYVLTYWEKNQTTGKWSLNTIAVPPSSATTFDINLTTQVDEIRFAPQGAMMSTYTHRPGAGIQSATDANNRSMIYEYDPFNRLRLIKDDQGQILKTFQYNYKQ